MCTYLSTASAILDVHLSHTHKELDYTGYINGAAFKHQASLDTVPQILLSPLATDMITRIQECSLQQSVKPLNKPKKINKEWTGKRII
jgi:hypothetical protein